MITRTQYLHHITRYRDTHDLVKVISGVRRSGKSLLMQQLHESLEQQGVPSSSIIHINFEDFTYRTVREAKDLYSHITSMLSKRGTTYILLDEIQMVKDWQEVVNSLRLTRRNDIYITGSNATLLSGTMATLLSGRYVEIRMLPLSFSEFLKFNDINDTGSGFTRYIRQGGLPGLVHLPQESDIIMEYLKGVVNTIVVKDISTHAQIRDIDILHKVIGFLASNIGQQVTATRIAHYLTSTGRKVSIETVDNYLRLLEEAFIFYRAKRFNIKGKELMKTNHKFYIVDLGLRHALIGSPGDDFGAALENVVFFELIRRGYQVTVGTYQDYEIDFIAHRSEETLYIQVCASILDETTRERELRSLRLPDDNYPRLILSMDTLPFSNFDGIRQMHILDFLLSTEM